MISWEINTENGPIEADPLEILKHYLCCGMGSNRFFHVEMFILAIMGNTGA